MNTQLAYQIQTPIDIGLKQLVETKAKFLLGLKNINDTIRFLLTNFVQDRISINIEPAKEILDYKNKLDQGYMEVRQASKQEKRTYCNSKDLMADLNN